MKISENWLREWVSPELTTDELVFQLTMAGLEVDSVEAAAPALDKVVVAEVISCEKHPDAERLNLCQVNDGSEQPVQVICGASNVKQGLKVVFAQVGAELPDFKIKKAKLRGIESYGMICSESELKLSDGSNGIMELAADAPIGQSITDYLQLNDTLIEIDLTPNRGDCLSVAGIAREVSANNDLPLTVPQIEDIPSTTDDVFGVELENKLACPHYVGRIIKNIDASAETPLWMQEKLRRSGMRSISPVVDVTNFVMAELGQPMHGFDLAKLSGGICVRNARADEKITLLDGTELTCRADTLVIADHEKALALAGIMGGLDSSVQGDTKDILLESAFFAPAQIAGKARNYGLHTDSSHRFERGVDSGLQVKAIQRATQLLLDIVGGQPGPVFEAIDAANMPQQPEIHLRHQRVERLLGISVDRTRVESILHSLEMQLSSTDEGWMVKAPSYRFDINIEADLIEEVGRLVGYNNIPGTKEAAHVSMESFSETRLSLNRLKDTLVTRGYHEAVTYAFVSPSIQKILHPEVETLSLANPISSDMSEMRTRLLPGLVQAVQHNLNRQQSRVRLFESGLCFIPDKDGLQQTSHIAAIISGPLESESWVSSKKEVDFYDIKGDLESLMQLVDERSFEFKPSTNEILHPGQSADIYVNGHLAGLVGALHPVVLKQLQVDQKLFVFEIETVSLQTTPLAKFRELSKFPSIRRDLALIVDQEVSAQQILDSVNSIKSEIIQDVFIFDVYTGGEVINNRKSVAFGLILQGFSRTLTEKDVGETVSQVLQLLEKEYKAVLR